MPDAAEVCVGKSSKPPRLPIHLTAIDRASPSLTRRFGAVMR
jgi:hypothetical protein